MGQFISEWVNAFGAGATITTYNQLVVAPNVVLFNMAGELALAQVLSWNMTQLVTSSPQQGPTRLSLPLTLPLPPLGYPMPPPYDWTYQLPLYLYHSGLPSYFGDLGNMASFTTWTCPATELWSLRQASAMLMTQAYNPTDATVTLQFTNSTFVGTMIAPGYTTA